MKVWGIFLIILGCLLIIFGNSATINMSVDSAMKVFPMSTVPPKEKISPTLLQVIKENPNAKVPVIVKLTAPPEMASAQQQTVVPQLMALGFNMTFNIMDVDNAVAGYVTAKNVYKIAENPYVSKVLYDVKIFKVFQIPQPLKQDDEIIKALQANLLGYTGKGVTVFLIDTGVDVNHPMLKGKVIKTVYAIPTDYVIKSHPSWTHPHGTHCAGIIVSVAPDVKIVNVVALDANGSARLSWLLKALDYVYSVADEYKPCVCSCSWGAWPINSPECNELREAVIRLCHKMPVVFAAGNFGPNSGTIACPADADDGHVEPITVGAVDSNLKIAWFSSRGPDHWGEIHKEPNVVAPGVEVVSAKAGGGYVTMSGTSMACPFVSGVVALMLQKNPSLTDEQCLQILEKTAKDLGPKGFDYEYGYGLVQADKALGLAGEYVTPHVQPNQAMTMIGLLVVVTGFVLTMRWWSI